VSPNALRGLLASTFAFVLGVSVPATVVADAHKANAAAEAEFYHASEIARAKAQTAQTIYAQQAAYFAADTDAEPEWNGDNPVHCWNGTACPDYQGD
jgi:hypothetical protein